MKPKFTISKKHTSEITTILRDKISSAKYVDTKLVFDPTNDLHYYPLVKNNRIVPESKLTHEESMNLFNRLRSHLEFESVKELFDSDDKLKFRCYESSWMPFGGGDVKRFPAIKLIEEAGTIGSLSNKLGKHEDPKEHIDFDVNFFGLVHTFKTEDETIKVYVRINWHAVYEQPLVSMATCQEYKKHMDLIYKPEKALEKGWDWLKPFAEIDGSNGFIVIKNEKTRECLKYTDLVEKDHPYVEVNQWLNDDEITGANGPRMIEMHRFVRCRDGVQGGLREVTANFDLIKDLTLEKIELVKPLYEKAGELFERFKDEYWTFRLSRKRNWRALLFPTPREDGTCGKFFRLEDGYVKSELNPPKKTKAKKAKK